MAAMTDLMRRHPYLFKSQYFVFSSQKTGTQTMVALLRASGFTCMMSHTFDDIGLSADEFVPYLDGYKQLNNRKMRIISIFRDPFDRLISSFFQSLSEERYAYLDGFSGHRGNVEGEPEVSIIYQMPLDELTHLFVRYCKEINGWGETLPLICRGLGISLHDLHFDEQEFLGTHEFHRCDLHLIRFDHLSHLSEILSRLTGKHIDPVTINLSNEKYYANRYEEFRHNARFPTSMITNVYDSRKDLIELFHPGQYQSILTAKCKQWSI